MAKTSIEWTDYSWPVLNGCRRKSTGCERCYAERLASTRLRHTERYKGLAVYSEHGPRWTGESRLDRAELAKPLSWKSPRRIFVCDMGDLFYEGNTFEQIDAVFGVMWACLYMGKNASDGHVFQTLTKRADRMLEYLSTDRRENWATHAVHVGGGSDPDGIYDQVRYFNGPHPRIHLGASVENQAAADERIPYLLCCPAAVRWVSAEPLLGPLDLSKYLFVGEEGGWEYCGSPRRMIDWVVTGTESGHGRRPADIKWIESIVERCRSASVPVFVKQIEIEGLHGKTRVSKDPTECGGWPKRLNHRMMPGDKWP